MIKPGKAGHTVQKLGKGNCLKQGQSRDTSYIPTTQRNGELPR
jgi:hypothetical protein